ncbi:MAG: hypothetical protein U0270_16965 [Labilithrix sp.]
MAGLAAAVEKDVKKILAPGSSAEEIEDALGRAFEKVKWPDVRMVPRVEDLTSEQRELVTRLGDRNLDVHRFFVPASGAIRRRWLGLTRGGVLEEKVSFTLEGKKRKEPLWRAVLECVAAGGEEAAAPIVQALSLEERLRAFGEVNACLGWGTAYGISTKLFFDWWDTALLERLRAEGKKWAPAFADALLAQVERRGSEPGESHWTLTSSCRWPVFLALVRAKITIEPRWDVLLPIGGQKALDACVECIRAIPEERRTAAIVSALGRELEPVSVGLPLLDLFPSAELARLIQRSTGGAGIPKQKIFAELDRLAQRHAVIRDALATKAKASAKAKAKASAKALVLTCAEVVRPKKFAKLELIHQLQLGIAGKRADGRDVPPAQRFAEEGFGAGFLEICKLTDASSGKHRYDALLFRADSGMVFEARAKRVVAEIIQDGVECKNAALRDAIEAALADRPRA